MGRASLEANICGILDAYRVLRSARDVTGEILAKRMGTCAKTARKRLHLLAEVYGLKLRYRKRRHTWRIDGPKYAVRYLDRLTRRNNRPECP